MPTEPVQTCTINGVAHEMPAGALAWKYRDPTEDPRWVFDADDLAEIRRDDPSLLVYADAGPRA